MKIWSFIAISLLLVSCASQGLEREKNILKPGQFATIIAFDRRIYCITAYKDQCGLRLINCSDGLQYQCGHNVIIFDPPKSSKYGDEI